MFALAWFVIGLKTGWSLQPLAAEPQSYDTRIEP